MALRVDNPDAALETVVEGALSSATSKHLGLDDHVVASYCCWSAVPQASPIHHVQMLLATASASWAVFATLPLGTPMPYCAVVSGSRAASGGTWRAAYGLEQGSRAVLVYGEVAGLLDDGGSQRSTLEAC